MRMSAFWGQTAVTTPATTRLEATPAAAELASCSLETSHVLVNKREAWVTRD